MESHQPNESEARDKSTMQAIYLEILRDRAVSNKVVEATGLLIAADARMNIWMLETGKSSKTKQEVRAIYKECVACLDAMRAAWSRFLDRDVAGAIERHNAKALEERTKPGALETLGWLMAEANAELEAELRRIRDRLCQLAS
jgi:hypothetical protein